MSWVRRPDRRSIAFAPFVLVTGVARYRYLLGFRREYWQQLKGVLGPYPIWYLRLGYLSALTGALGGDGAPVCATNSSEQDDFAVEVLIPPGGRPNDRESTLRYMVM